MTSYSMWPIRAKCDTHIVISIFTVRNEVAKVMFLQASVCPQGLGVRGCLPQCMVGYHTPCPRSMDPPSADTPLEQTPRADTPWSRHHPGADTPMQTPPRSRHPPGADTPQEQTPPRSRHPQSRHPPEQTPPKQTPPEQTPPPQSRHPLEQTPPRNTVTAADSTHPTGMHSCWYWAHYIFFKFIDCIIVKYCNVHPQTCIPALNTRRIRYSF